MSGFEGLGKVLIIVVLGLVFAFGGRIPFLGKLPGDIGRLLTGGSGNVELGFRLGGTTTDPSVKLDTRLVARRLENRLKEQAGKLLNRLLSGSGASGDSVATDSASTVKKSLRGLLKNLLKKN